MSDAPMLFILYDRPKASYILGGGSSSPARERIYYSMDVAIKNRDRHFPHAEIHLMHRHAFDVAPEVVRLRHIIQAIVKTLRSENLTAFAQKIEDELVRN